MNFRGVGVDGNDARQQPGAAQALARQSSVYALTFDEFQSSMGGIGKDFGSMNMDEFLKNIWTAEESQAMAAALGASDGGVVGGSVGLQRQGSITLPRTLSQKTVDEVWRDVINESGGGGSGAGAGGSGFQQHQRQPTLGEMTLEEFLVRAGVVKEEINMSTSRPAVNGIASSGSNVYYGNLSASGTNNTGIALGFPQAGQGNLGIMPASIPSNSSANLPMPASGTRPYAPQLPLGSNVNLGSPRAVRGGGLVGIGDQVISNGLITGVVGLGVGGVNVGASVSPVHQIPSDELAKGNGDLSSLSPVPYVFNGGLRGRKCSGAVEKVVERRQKRMIKNRESAARSRARKQAYTMELEAEVAQLKEQNQELQKKQAEFIEMQKKQVLEILNQQRATKKLCLRRTQTGPW
ncbi:ABSCISIC ACID-INSENSITIVE 5-like protein 5 [Phalaenopsis equestris]|uniref:ABSCISIC ACID-INSENSITIVE 5-like protein 5 n=1 Tax=Phalaenopsis equestris TaxID=78828 RepID=UPI0009E26F0F|nr:ABSCISIC ACID-INSENSITIVE 5-like protein 5 [Phalaenopsis equestris]